MRTALWSGGQALTWITASPSSRLPGMEGKNRLLGIYPGLRQDGWEE